jgi:hypothetical protein
MMNNENFASLIANERAPDWVPRLVVRTASAMRSFAQEKTVDRLLIDSRMKVVWRTLKTRKVTVSAIESLPTNRRLDNWLEASLETRDATLSNRACVAFFASAVIEFTLANKPAYASDVTKLIEPWRNAAQQCRIALKNPLFRPRIDGEVEKSLAVAERFFEEQAKFVDSGSSPYLLERQGDDDSTKAIVRGLGSQTRAIFGGFLYGTIATTVNVGLQLDAEIGRETVRNWCDRL